MEKSRGTTHPANPLTNSHSTIYRKLYVSVGVSVSISKVLTEAR